MPPHWSTYWSTLLPDRMQLAAHPRKLLPAMLAPPVQRCGCGRLLGRHIGRDGAWLGRCAACSTSLGLRSMLSIASQEYLLVVVAQQQSLPADESLPCRQQALLPSQHASRQGRLGRARSSARTTCSQHEALPVRRLHGEKPPDWAGEAERLPELSPDSLTTEAVEAMELTALQQHCWKACISPKGAQDAQLQTA